MIFLTGVCNVSIKGAKTKENDKARNVDGQTLIRIIGKLDNFSTLIGGTPAKLTKIDKVKVMFEGGKACATK